jgi:hypothetical protein
MPTQAYGIKLTLPNIAVDGQNVKLKDLCHLLRGE